MSKSKVLAACAIGAIAVLVLAGAVRCTANVMAGGGDQAQQQEQREGAGDDGSAQEGDAMKKGFGDYYGTAWKTADGSATLTLTEGTMVEQGAGAASVTYFEVTGEDAGEGYATADLSVRHAANEAAKDTVASIDISASAVVLTCDELQISKTYVLDAGHDTTVGLAAHDAELNDLMRADDDAISQAISAWAAKYSPYATSAAWDGEVYIDCAGGTVTTSFELNDGARTLVQLQLDRKTGKVAAL